MASKRCHDTQHNSIHPNDTQHDYKKIQHSAYRFWMILSIVVVLSVAFKLVMLNVVKLSVILLSGVASPTLFLFFLHDVVKIFVKSQKLFNINFIYICVCVYGCVCVCVCVCMGVFVCVCV
jgi:hypothetical protein